MSRVLSRVIEFHPAADCAIRQLVINTTDDGDGHKERLMSWPKRLLLISPFAVAAVLTALIIIADRLHLRSEHIAGFAFLFGAPWAWLLDHGWFGNVQSRGAESLITYAVILWIPALLYSACLWLLLRGLGVRKARGK
jgi:hypothetical protein